MLSNVGLPGLVVTLGFMGGGFGAAFLVAAVSSAAGLLAFPPALMTFVSQIMGQ